VALLRTVAQHNEHGVRLSRIARQVGLHVATARRLLMTLVAEGLLTHDRVTKLYHLGLELHQLGSLAHQYAIRNKLRFALEAIAAKTEDTVFLLIRSGNDVLCIDMVEGKFPIRTMMIDVGARRPLGIGAGSLSLIAFLSDEEFEAMLAVNGPRYPQYKNLRAEDIRQMGLAARKVGYVLSDGLFHEGATSVGVPIFDREGEGVAAITVSAISPRMDPKRRDKIARLVKREARSGKLVL